MIENNAGYDIFPTMMFGRTGGRRRRARRHRRDGHGCASCGRARRSRRRRCRSSPRERLVYLYTKLLDAPRGPTRTTHGRRLPHRPDGLPRPHRHGLGYDNNWALVTIGPDGTAYVGTLRGLLAVVTERKGSDPQDTNLRAQKGCGKRGRSATQRARGVMLAMLFAGVKSTGFLPRQRSRGHPYPFRNETSAQRVEHRHQRRRLSRAAAAGRRRSR